MYELKNIGKVLTSKFVGTGPSSYKKKNYRAAVSQRLRNTGVNVRWSLVLICGQEEKYVPECLLCMSVGRCLPAVGRSVGNLKLLDRNVSLLFS